MYTLGHASYAVMLMAMAIVMATVLVSFAIVFDSYVLNREVPIPEADIDGTLSDIKTGKIWDSIVKQFKQLS